jgi:hypothetical protein
MLADIDDNDKDTPQQQMSEGASMMDDTDRYNSLI